jgi:hypothetical protein
MKGTKYAVKISFFDRVLKFEYSSYGYTIGSREASRCLTAAALAT